MVVNGWYTCPKCRKKLLRVLKTSKLVKFRKEGKTVYYSLADDHVCRILSQGMEHICE